MPIALLLLVVLSCSAAPDNATSGIVGDWAGRIGLPGTPLDVGIRFTDDGGGLGGTIDIPAQGVTALPLGEVRLDDRAVSFTLPGMPGNAAFRGTLEGSGDAATIRGDFTQSGGTYPLSLSRGTVKGPARPQEPQPPFPYRSEDVTYRSGNVDLAGTLTLPKGDGPFTAVLLLTGSGAQDRDGTGDGHKPFLLLADTLTRAGYAVLRVDDRGVGGSGGDLAATTYDDLTGDALAGVEYLKGRADIDPARIGLFGHSEGGYLAPLAAQRSGTVAFVIMMAGPAEIEATARARATPSSRSFVTYNPGPALDALDVPMFAFFGGKDLQVPPAQSEPVLRERLADNPDATVRTFPGLNHLMQPATTGIPGEYAMIETTISPEVLDATTRWMRARY